MSVEYPVWAKYESVSVRSDTLALGKTGELPHVHVRAVSNEYRLHRPFEYPDETDPPMVILDNVTPTSFRVSDGEWAVTYYVVHHCCGSCTARRGELSLV